MTFLYTAFLTALAAATIPLILHLLNRRRMPLVKFSTLEFLKRFQKKKARRIQIRQIILLVIRTVAIIAVVLAFSRPALRSGNSGGSASAVEIIIIVDNGVTSFAESTEGRVFDLTASAALTIGRTAGIEDRITLIPATHPVEFNSFTSNQELLVENWFEDLQPSYVPLRLDAAVEVADSILTSTHRFNRELYFIGGFYENEYDSLELSGLDHEIKTYFIPVSGKSLINYSIDKVEIRNTILQAGTPVELKATITNHTDSRLEGTLVSVYLDNERVAQSSLEIPGKSTIEKTFLVTPRKPGQLEGYVKLDEIDDLSVDNRRFFVLDIPEIIKVLAVTSDSLSRLVVDAVTQSRQLTNIEIEWYRLEKWESASLAGFDVLLMTGVNHVSSGSIDRIVDFVSNGNSLIIFQGENPDIADLSRGLWKKLGLSEARNVLKTPGITWDKPDFSHPLFDGIFEKDGRPRSPSFTSVVDITVGKGDHVIISLSNGSPLLIERKLRNGTILFYTVELSPSSGDFAFTGILAPLIYNSIGYSVSTSKTVDHSWTVGSKETIIISMRDVVNGKLIRPDDLSIKLVPRQVMSGLEFTVNEVDMPGNYDLVVEDHSAGEYSANINTKSSSLQRIHLKDLAKRLNGSIFEGGERELHEVILGARYGREFWIPLALIFLLLLITESVIGRTTSKENAK